MKKTTCAERRVATAYHEAGHAVAHVFFRVPLRKATIKGDEDYLGAVVGEKLGRKLIVGFESGFPTPAQRDRLERQVICLLAGALAERHFTGHRNNRGSSWDDGLATDLLLHLAGGSLTEVPAYARWLRIRASNAMLSPLRWPAVQRVASALLEHETLQAAEIRQLVNPYQIPPWVPP